MIWLYILLRPSRWIWWPWEHDHRPPTKAWLIIWFVMAMAYRPKHPWNGLIAGVAVIVLACIIAYYRGVKNQERTQR